MQSKLVELLRHLENVEQDLVFYPDMVKRDLSRAITLLRTILIDHNN